LLFWQALCLKVNRSLVDLELQDSQSRWKK
jgi:hypothetical protein